MGATQAQYVWSPVYVDAMIERDSGGQRLYVQQDANFNVTALIDTSGNVVERYTYDPYGTASFWTGTWSTQSGSAYASNYLYQGGRYDLTTGLYHFRNRDYSPTLGRFTSWDPIRYDAGDNNLYRFVGNSPTNSQDPSGLDNAIGGIAGGWGQGGNSPKANWANWCQFIFCLTHRTLGA